MDSIGPKGHGAGDNLDQGHTRRPVVPDLSGPSRSNAAGMIGGFEGESTTCSFPLHAASLWHGAKII